MTWQSRCVCQNVQQPENSTPPADPSSQIRPVSRSLACFAPAVYKRYPLVDVRPENAQETRRTTPPTPSQPKRFSTVSRPAHRGVVSRNRIRSTRLSIRIEFQGDDHVVASVSVNSVRRCFAAAAAAFGARARRAPDRSHPGGVPSLPPRPAPVARVGVRGQRARTDDRGRARPASPCRVAQRARRRPARPGHGRAGRDRRRWRAGAVPARAERRHRRSARGGAEGLHGRAPARRPDAGSLRRLDGEHLGSGPARGQRLSDGPARGVALVPRPRDGRHAVYRVRGTGRPVDRSRPA